MAVLEPQLVDPSSLSSAKSAEAPCGVVSLHGDLETSAVVALSSTLAKAIAADDEADVILDFTEVGFLDPVAAEMILRARDLLRFRSRRLTVRSPSLGAWRALEGAAGSTLALYGRASGCSAGPHH